MSWYGIRAQEILCIIFAVSTVTSILWFSTKKSTCPLLNFRISYTNLFLMPVPVAARSKGLGLRPLAYWDREFESRRGHGCLSVVNVICCQVEVSATSWSLVQRSPTDCDASSCVIKKPQEWGGPRPRGAAAPQEKKSVFNVVFCLLITKLASLASVVTHTTLRNIYCWRNINYLPHNKTTPEAGNMDFTEFN